MNAAPDIVGTQFRVETEAETARIFVAGRTAVRADVGIGDGVAQRQALHQGAVNNRTGRCAVAGAEHAAVPAGGIGQPDFRADVRAWRRDHPDLYAAEILIGRLPAVAVAAPPAVTGAHWPAFGGIIGLDGRDRLVDIGRLDLHVGAAERGDAGAALGGVCVSRLRV